VQEKNIRTTPVTCVINENGRCVENVGRIATRVISAACAPASSYFQLARTIDHRRQFHRVPPSSTPAGALIPLVRVCAASGSVMTSPQQQQPTPATSRRRCSHAAAASGVGCRCIDHNEQAPSSPRRAAVTKGRVVVSNGADGTCQAERGADVD